MTQAINVSPLCRVCGQPTGNPQCEACGPVKARPIGRKTALHRIAYWIENTMVPGTASEDAGLVREAADTIDRLAADLAAAREKLAEATNVIQGMLDVWNNHDAWCGHNANAPGWSHYRQIDAAKSFIASRTLSEIAP